MLTHVTQQGFKEMSGRKKENVTDRCNVRENGILKIDCRKYKSWRQA